MGIHRNYGRGRPNGGIGAGAPRARPDIVIADYHLEDGSTGVAAVDEVRAVFGSNIPGLIITADRSLEVLEIVRRRGLHLLKKPVKPAKLQALVSHLLAQGQRRPATLEHPSIRLADFQLTGGDHRLCAAIDPKFAGMAVMCAFTVDSLMPSS